ncbi:MAG: T9SS type A sorting domain-containing protein, partial [Bacteroidia bacterium]|nr:T9SS type A sorting domain-containing protein [Bacteroidia bacterium]
MNGDFLNWGLGGGNYNCSPTEQGISSGYTDIYYQYLDGMYINIPPGTCNGDYYIVVHLDPYDYFLESNENNNVEAVPITLTQQSPPGGQATITAQGATDICLGESVNLVANAGTSFFWSNGATTQSIQVNQTGSYAVTVSSSCGTGTSPAVNVNVIDPQITSIQGDTIWAGNSATLSASVNTGSVDWYDALVGGALLHSGNVFTTPILNGSHSFFAEATYSAQSAAQFAPPHNNGFGGGNIHSDDSRYLIFNCHSEMILESVLVYAQGGGNRTIQLRDASNAVISSVTAYIPDGQSRVQLNMIIQPGQDLRLGLANGTTANLFRNDSGVNYPYSVNGFVDINGSSAGSNYYYFFYDWEVNALADTCTSSNRTQVDAVVLVGIDEVDLSDGINLYPNPSDGILNVEFRNNVLENSLIYVYDVQGRLVHSETILQTLNSGSKLELDLQHLSSGIYNLSVTSEGKSVNKNFTVY